MKTETQTAGSRAPSIVEELWSTSDMHACLCHTRARNLKDKVNRLLRRYCMAFVTCKQCHSARTVLTRGDDRNIQNRSSTTQVIRLIRQDKTRSSTTMELSCLDCHARLFMRRL